MSAIRAIYEGGVFRPIDPVDLPDNAHVVFEPRVVKNGEPSAGNDDKAQASALSRVYEVLSRSYDTRISDLAARHDEHRP